MSCLFHEYNFTKFLSQSEPGNSMIYVVNKSSNNSIVCDLKREPFPANLTDATKCQIISYTNYVQ